MITVPFGYDYGNAETCGYLIENGMKRSKRIPSATVLGSLSDLAEKRSAVRATFDRDVSALQSDEYVVEINDSEFFVGNLAYRESRSATTGYGDVNRYWSPKALAVLLTISGEMIGSPEYELFVVTGLPIETFTKENRERVRGTLEGDHRFILNGRQRRAIIHVSRVVMEGAGAMIVYGRNEDVLQGVIDIGGRTTDLYAAQGQRPLAQMCQGKDIGVEEVAKIVSRKFNAKYGRQIKNDEMQRILTASLNGSYPTLQSQGVLANESVLRPWTENAIKEVSLDILSFISRTWNTSERGAVAADIAPVLIIGGGAYYFTSQIKARIPHAIVPMKPEAANAEGYATLASVLMSRNRAIA